MTSPEDVGVLLPDVSQHIGTRAQHTAAAAAAAVTTGALLAAVTAVSVAAVHGLSST
jgi:hypothetical protein